MKPFIKFLDKIVILLLIMMGMMSSCKDDPTPTPEYGMIVPMYGVVPDKSVTITQDTANSKQNIQKIDEVDTQCDY